MSAPTRTRSRVHPQRASTRAAGGRTGGNGATRRDRSTATRHSTPRHNTTRRETAQRGRTSAAQKAYARRAQRSEAVSHSEVQLSATKGVLSMLKLRLPASRASFVVLVMSLLAGGVALTLWLSTQAIADSYRLESVRAQTASLVERAERLQRDVAREESAAALARKARQLGMVPSGEPARLLVTPRGKPKLVGEPKVIARPAPPVQHTPERESSARRPAQNERREADRDDADTRRQAAAATRQGGQDGVGEGN